MAKFKKVSRFEYELLSELAENGPMSVRALFESFGQPRGFIRGTIVKSCDRLMRKKLLRRRSVDGVFVYSSVHSKEELDELTTGAVIDDIFGGSLKPLVSFFSGTDKFSRDEIAELRRTLQKLESKLKDEE